MTAPTVEETFPGYSPWGDEDVADAAPVEMTPLDSLRAALIDTDGLDGIPDPDPLIGSDILFTDCINWMIGKPGCKKSFTALDIAGCVATGETWHSYPVRQGPVLYLVAEGVRGTKKRVRAWEQMRDVRMTGVHFLPVAVQATNRAYWDAFVALAAELCPVLIVVDTQARVTVGMKENEATDMGVFAERCEDLRKAAGSCVLIVHHQGRQGDNGRGSSALDGALSTIIRVTSDEDRVRLDCDKNKDGEEWDTINLRAVPAGDSIVLVADDGRRGHGQRLALLRSWWAAHRDDPVSVSVLVKSEVVTETTFHRIKHELMDSGAVVRIGTGNQTKYQLTGDPDGS